MARKWLMSLGRKSDRRGGLTLRGREAHRDGHDEHKEHPRGQNVWGTGSSQARAARAP